MGFVIAAGVFLILGIALESITSWIAIRVARKRHPELWAHSGKPTLWGNRDLMKAWPLVKYYRDRRYLEPARQEDQQLPPVADTLSLEFAERLRRPFLFTYCAGCAGFGIAGLMLLASSILQS